jgi:carbonic anhydrase
MSVTDELIRNAEKYAEQFDKGDLPLPPARKVAVVACMDARLIPTKVLGLEEGDAHVIRNAGGVVTDDEIRSLAISQRLLGTEEIILIHHTDCGMLTFTDDDFKRSVEDDTGIRPAWAAEAFNDLDKDVLQSIARIQASPFIPARTPSAASSTRWRRGGCARSRRRRGLPLPAHGRGAGPAGGQHDHL